MQLGDVSKSMIKYLLFFFNLLFLVSKNLLDFWKYFKSLNLSTIMILSPT